ncbi:hypothetical protein NLI96_g4579 [Meripilus lineatus]|uniref:Uncharacterized protein n=1 Tax=Meripilus lineatus TaxID=2056292 RepID=A0AAD5V9M2_9APHY|nr:hypothetical protein NLI96_g4579 [Physisporinus lineatus]
MASPFSSPTPGTEAPVGQLTRLIPGSIYSSLRLAHESERDDTATTPPPLGALGDTPPPARFSRDFKIHDQKTKDKLAAEAMEMPSVGISYDLWMSSFTPTLPTATPGSPALSSSKYLMDKINCCGPEAPSYCKLVDALQHIGESKGFLVRTTPSHLPTTSDMGAEGDNISNAKIDPPTVETVGRNSQGPVTQCDFTMEEK